MAYEWLKNYPDEVPQGIVVGSDETLVAMFEGQCQRFADLPAFVNRGMTLSYQEIDALSAHFAAYLQTLGLSKGDKVALMLPNLLQYPVAFFGILRAGLVVINVNPSMPAPELAYLLKDSSAKAVVVLANFAHVIEAALPDTALEHVVVTQLGDLLSPIEGVVIDFAAKYVKRLVPSFHLPDAIEFKQALALGEKKVFKPVGVSSEDLALLQYTGATTGHPKGAMLSHRNLVANIKQCLAWVAPVLEEGKERVVIALPLFHIFSLTVACLSFMQIGACGILITNPRDIKGFLRVLKREKVSAFVGLDTLFDALMEKSEFADIDFSALNLVVAGGMPLRESVAQRWVSMTERPIVMGYGLTEASPVITINPTRQNKFTGSVGLPIPSTIVEIRDEQGQLVDTGQPGIVWAKGPQVMRCYWHNDEATHEAIDAQGWLNTGDIGYLDQEGFLFLIDRAKDLIIVSGFNVYPAEVDAVLAGMPGIKEAAVIGVPDEHSGEALKAFVVRDNPEISRKAIISYCREQILAYKIPRDIEFVEELPKSQVGKVLRRMLRE